VAGGVIVFVLQLVQDKPEAPEMPVQVKAEEAKDVWPESAMLSTAQ